MLNLANALELGRRALAAQQLSLGVTGHNIANVNAEGYTRQRVYLRPTLPVEVGSLVVGTGVEIDRIERIRDDFLDAQIREEKQSLGMWRYEEQVLQEIESIFNEPSDAGLNAVLDQFWEAWNNLANDPENGAVRVALREQALTFTATLNHLDAQLQELRQGVDLDVLPKMEEVNSIARQIADLNRQIGTLEVRGGNANDYRDRQDFLIDRLSNLINIQVVKESDGMVMVTVAGKALVTRDHVVELSTEAVSKGGIRVLEVIWADNSGLVNLTGGELKGLLEVRDTIIPKYQDQLDELAATLIAEVNAIHSLGYGLAAPGGSPPTGSDFFTGTDAGSIALAGPILDDIRNIAASSDGFPGDNGIAVAILKLREELTMNSNTATFNDYYGVMVDVLGVESRKASQMSDNQQVLVTHLEDHRKSISSVSLDEEMTNLIRFEHAYAAAARFISTLDKVMNILMGML